VPWSFNFGKSLPHHRRQDFPRKKPAGQVPRPRTGDTHISPTNLRLHLVTTPDTDTDATPKDTAAMPCIRTLPRLVLAALSAPLAGALLVAPGSPCSTSCGNELSSSSPAEMVCREDAYTSSSAGIVFGNCVKCETSSTYATESGKQSDLQALTCKLQQQRSAAPKAANLGSGLTSHPKTICVSTWASVCGATWRIKMSKTLHVRRGEFLHLGLGATNHGLCRHS
jgi:hypothetical protein